MIIPVLDLQRRLKEIGFDDGAPGFVDGIMGVRTRAAVTRFQISRGLLADGIVGPKTAAALRAFEDGADAPILNRAEFALWAPDAVPNTVDALEAAIRAYPQLRERAVLDDWLGQMWVESQGFSTLVENLNYSVDGLLNTFGRHRISVAQAQKYGRAPGQRADQEAIANIVYGGEWGRKNLGNTQPGDGWLFRGSGVKQITGRANTEASGFTPQELREDIFKSCRAAADFFVSHGCVEPARRGDISGVTKKVNGGTNGLTERSKKTASARKVIL